MNTKKNYAILFVWMLILTSCAKVEVKDSEFCGDMGVEGATCFHLLSENSRELTKPEWDQERFGMICGKAEAFSNLKTVALKLCAITRRCTFDEINGLIKLGDKIYELEKRINGEPQDDKRRD